MRMDPPPSPPPARGTMPDATAAADPPLEPPGVRLTSQRLRVGPKEFGLGGGDEPEFRGVGFPENHDPRLLVSAHQFRRGHSARSFGRPWSRR